MLLVDLISDIHPGYGFMGNQYGTMNGLVDELRIWDVARTAEQILANYDKAIVPELAEGLVGYWPMNEGSGTTVYDITGNGLNRTLVNNTTWSTDNSNIETPVNSDLAFASDYRYGFNGKEADDDDFGDTHYDYGFRIYNPRIARFLSVDPLTKSYPMLTPYQFASNTPIGAIDLDGLEAYITSKCNTDGSTQLTLHIDLQIKNSTDLPASTIRQMGEGIKSLVENRLKGYLQESQTYVNTQVYICFDNDARFDNNINNENNDYFIEFVPRVKYNGSWSLNAGLTGSDARNSDFKDWIGNSDFNRMQVQLDRWSNVDNISRTGAHEILHSLGIYHPSDAENDIPITDNDNLAHQSIRTRGTKVSKEQIMRIIEIVSGEKPNLNGRYNKLTKMIKDSDTTQKTSNENSKDNKKK